MVDLEELRKSTEANKDRTVCDPCQGETKFLPMADTRMVHLTPSERRIERTAPRMIGAALPRDGVYTGPARIILVDEDGNAQYVDPRLIVTPRGVKLRPDSHLGAVSGDC